MNSEDSLHVSSAETTKRGKSERKSSKEIKMEKSQKVSIFFSIFFFLVFAVSSASDKSQRELIKARIIPDVIDAFVPSAKLKVSYGGIRVVNGLLIPPSNASKAPSVKIITRRRLSHKLYTLIVADPDAPSPDNPIRKEILHWLVINIPGTAGLKRGEEIVPYVGPAPPQGVHRYVFSLYRQRKALRGVKPPEGRAFFRTRGFAAANKLGKPVAALYFNSTKVV